jgi:hypothetical protein
MIPVALLRSLPPGTRYEARADGFELALSGASSVRVRERLRPLIPAASAFAAARAAHGLPCPDPGARVTELVTNEGELAALDHARIGATAVATGVVFGDDFFRLVSGHARDAAAGPELGDLVRNLTVALPLGLAYLRRRLYRYAPPAGWAPRGRPGLVTEWLAPGYPHEAARLTVFPAYPRREPPTATLERLGRQMSSAGFEPETDEEAARASVGRMTESRLRLVARPAGGPSAHAELVALGDASFVYLLRLDHGGAAPELHRAALAGVIADLQPIPPPRA